MLWCSKACLATQVCIYRLTSRPLANAPNFISLHSQRFYSKGKDDKVDLELPGKEFINADKIPEKGKIYDKKPFKFACVKGQKYMWCACGYSRTQPFCDGTHKNPKINMYPTVRPVRFVPTEDKEFWFCNCKQTSKRPFCDGTHKREDIQAAVRS